MAASTAEPSAAVTPKALDYIFGKGKPMMTNHEKKFISAAAKKDEVDSRRRSLKALADYTKGRDSINHLFTRQSQEMIQNGFGSTQVPMSDPRVLMFHGQTTGEVQSNKAVGSAISNLVKNRTKSSKNRYFNKRE